MENRLPGQTRIGRFPDTTGSNAGVNGRRISARCIDRLDSTASKLWTQHGPFEICKRRSDRHVPMFFPGLQSGLAANLWNLGVQTVRQNRAFQGQNQDENDEWVVLHKSFIPDEFKLDHEPTRLLDVDALRDISRFPSVSFKYARVNRKSNL